MTNTERELFERVSRLERANKRLALGIGALLLLGGSLATIGWQQTSDAMELLRVRRLEVVDARGVPMVQLGTGRSSEGGSIVLRDRLGERRAWWTASPEGSSLALTHEKSPDAGASTAGLSASSAGSEMNLIGPKGALLSATVRSEQPRVDLWNAAGQMLFGAPWKSGARRP